MKASAHHHENKSYFFDHKWRDLIADVCKRIDIDDRGFQVISPFGFEVFEDRSFLSRSIKRLYCYIGIPQSMNGSTESHAISKKFLEKLLPRLNEASISIDDIAIIVTQDKFTLCKSSDYECKKTDKLIDIQTRFVDKDILNDYAKYIICTVDSISNGKDEPKYFFTNKRHRNRTYQIYVMLEKIFEDFLPRKTALQAKMYNDIFKFIDNSIQMFFTPSELLIDASINETKIMTSLIKPRVDLIRRNIALSSSPSDIINVKCNAYHVEEILELTINRNICNTAMQKICSTYLNY